MNTSTKSARDIHANYRLPGIVQVLDQPEPPHGFMIAKHANDWVVTWREPFLHPGSRLNTKIFVRLPMMLPHDWIDVTVSVTMADAGRTVDNLRLRPLSSDQFARLGLRDS